MKKILYSLAIIFTGYLISCSPDKYDVQKMGIVDMEQVKEIRLRTSHFQLLADGKAQLEFSPLLLTKEGYEIADSRVDHSRIEYYTSSGERLQKTFSTSDKALIGKEIQVSAMIKGRDITSNAVAFTVVDPAVVDSYTEMTIPVVFHLIQSKDDITAYGGEVSMERIHLLLDKINHTFSGEVSRNATGVDTKIRFKPAEYGPYGNKLPEPGINRIYVDKVIDESKDQYKTFIDKQKALWPYEHYLNVWLISDRNAEYKTFYSMITTRCTPRYTIGEANLTGQPQGLTLSPVAEDWKPVPCEVGILYKLQSIYTMARTFGATSENELVSAFGYYLGLLPTWKASGSKPEDYCMDTHKYFGNDVNGYKKNVTEYKLIKDCFFLSENIMDDPVGIHRSVTLQQSQRARWILNHCPERSAWKSNFAFTGK